MSEASFFKRHWKLLLNIFTIAALVILAYAIRHQLVDTLKNLTQVNAWALLLIIPVEIVNYHAQAKLYKRLFAVVDEEVSYRDMMKMSVELNFVNHVFPSGGVSGISYFSLRMRSLGVRALKATLVQTTKLVLLFLSFEVLLIIGMFILAANGKASNLTILIGSSLSTLLIVGTAIAVYIISSKPRINSSLTFVTKALNRLIRVVRPGKPETINVAQARMAFDDFHNDYTLLRSRLHKLKQPFWWALLANVTEVLAIYVVYVAFGDFVNVGAVILAYAVANFAGLVSVLPGGVGVYEALMTAVLVTAGVPAALSIPVTVMYRVLNTVLQLPPGYVLYHRSLNRRQDGSTNG